MEESKKTNKWKKDIRSFLKIMAVLSLVGLLILIFAPEDVFFSAAVNKTGYIVSLLITLPFVYGILMDKRWGYIGFGLVKIIDTVLSLALGNGPSGVGLAMGILALVVAPREGETSNESLTGTVQEIKESTEVDKNLKELKELEGEDAVDFAIELPDSWMCVCGTENAKDALNCTNCHRNRDYVLKRWTEKGNHKKQTGNKKPLENRVLESCDKEKEQSKAQNSAMVCPNCGAEVFQSYRYCEKCGAELGIQSNDFKAEKEETKQEQAEMHDRGEVRQQYKAEKIEETNLSSSKQAKEEIKKVDKKSKIPLSIDEQKTSGLLIPFRKGDKWGYCNENKNLVIPAVFDEAGRFSEGLAPVKINGKWGFIDSSGRLCIPAIYEKVELFLGGIANVSLNKRKAYVDKKGNQYWED